MVIEQLFSVTRPNGHSPAFPRHLVSESARFWKRLDVNLRIPRLDGDVGDPVSIRREHRAGLHGIWRVCIDFRFSLSREWHRPYSEVRSLLSHEGEDLSVG